MRTETLERSLRDHPFVAGMPEDHVRFLLGCTKNVRYGEGEYVVREDEPADFVYLVRRGRIALENRLPGRGTTVLETMEPGDVMGWAALFPPHVWNVDARAIEPTLTFAVDGSCLRSKLEADHTFGYEIMRRLLRIVHEKLDRSRLQQLDVYRGGDG